jgi:hypothetical protein
MTSPLDEAVERVKDAFERTDEEGFSPEIEQVFMDYLPTILNALSPDEPDPRASILAIIRANRQAGESEQVLTRDLTTLFRALQASRVSPDEERVARAIAYEFDVDADMFIGMHGREKWEKQWHPIARAAIQSIVGERP